jgi:glycosyltransferase involved in cell wall biosynthesis
MKKVLILVAHRPQRSPSQRYRFEQYLPFLEAHGFSFSFSPLLNEADDRLFYSSGNFIKKIIILLKTLWIRWKDVRRFKNFDTIFIQREALFFGTSYVEKRAAKSGAKVIFDFDDSIWLADTSPGNKKFEWVKNPLKFFDNVSYADTVIAGNAYLASKTNAPKKTVVIPTTIDTNFHKPNHIEKTDTTITIGWAGSISTLKHFETLLPVLLKLQDEFGDKICVKLMGQKKYSHPQLKTTSVNWNHAEEVVILNSFDIGIMPLPDDEWANGKCGLKALTYMACGIPTIASAVGVNKEIIKHDETGFLATNEQEWLLYLRALITNSSLRMQLGNAGKKRVIEEYSVEKWKPHYLDVFQK